MNFSSLKYFILKDKKNLYGDIIFIYNYNLYQANKTRTEAVKNEN